MTAQELIAYNNESNTKSLFKAARKVRAAEALQLHNWNVSYHTRQVNHRQTLYGDRSM